MHAEIVGEHSQPKAQNIFRILFRQMQVTINQNFDINTNSVASDLGSRFADDITLQLKAFSRHRKNSSMRNIQQGSRTKILTS
jgi:hypothetical protein